MVLKQSLGHGQLFSMFNAPHTGSTFSKPPLLLNSNYVNFISRSLNVHSCSQSHKSEYINENNTKNGTETTLYQLDLVLFENRKKLIIFKLHNYKVEQT